MALFKRRPEQAPPALPSVGERLLVWQSQDDRLSTLIELAHNFRGLTAQQVERVPVALKPGERVYLIITGAALVEPRSNGGQWQGRSSGVSVRIPGTRSARYRIGANKGQYVRNEDKPTVIDEGTAIVTDRRVAFAGAKQAREWQWSKCLGVQHQPEAPWTAIAVSNRQKTSGILYGEAAGEMVRFRLDLAYAVATGEIDDLAAELDAERAEHRSHQPGAALPPPPAQ
jgi:hypothetical protein